MTPSSAAMALTCGLFDRTADLTVTSMAWPMTAKGPSTKPTYSDDVEGILGGSGNDSITGGDPFTCSIPNHRPALPRSRHRP